VSYATFFYVLYSLHCMIHSALAEADSQHSKLWYGYMAVQFWTYITLFKNPLRETFIERG